MRLEDLHDYLALRRIAENPWEIVRFRKRGGRSDRVEVCFRDGRRLLIRGGQQDFHIFHRIFLRDEYRLDRLEGHRFDCVVDLGANVGYFAVRVADRARRVVCYEPSAENFDVLRSNLARIAHASAVREAVSGRAGRLRLYRPPRDSMSARFSLYPSVGGHRYERFDEVVATTLDELIERHGIERCDLLKLDVEGAEYEILGQASLATLARIRRIYGEYHRLDGNPERSFEGLARLLRASGFSVEGQPSRRHPDQGHFFAERP